MIGSPTPVADEVRRSLDSYMEEEVAKIITAPVDQFDATFDAIIAEYKALGGDEMVTELQAAWAAQQ
jgi:hypothetical protein